jgi:hypothetical protein
LDMLDEVREAAHIWEFAAKQRATRRYNSKVKPREMKEGDLFSDWEGPYRIKGKLFHGA